MKAVETGLRSGSEAKILIQVSERIGATDADDDLEGRRPGFEGLAGKENERSAAVERIEKTFDEILSELADMAKSVKEVFLEATEAPNQISLELGIAVSAEGSLIVAKVGTDVNFKMVVTWDRPGERAENGEP